MSDKIEVAPNHSPSEHSFMSKHECWSGHDLVNKMGTAAIAGAAIGSIGDGVGALPGFSIGSLAGVGIWFGQNIAGSVMNQCATKHLPPLTIDAADKK
jgi:hypothetical protein